MSGQQIKPPKCIVCKKQLEPAARRNSSDSDDEWLQLAREMPADAVVFIGGDNFGSSVADSLVSGYQIEIHVCDECLKERSDMVQKVSIKRSLDKQYLND